MSVEQKELIEARRAEKNRIAKEHKKLEPYLAKYKQEYWKKIQCCNCGTTEDVRHDEQSCDDYCWLCLEKYLLENPEELVESVTENEEDSYER